MRLRFIGEGGMSSQGYRFDADEDVLREQDVIDEIGEYLLNAFPKKFKQVDLIPDEEKIIPEVEVNTTPVTKAKTNKTETQKKKRGRPPKKKPETDPVSVKKN